MNVAQVQQLQSENVALREGRSQVSFVSTGSSAADGRSQAVPVVKQSAMLFRTPRVVCKVVFTREAT